MLSTTPVFTDGNEKSQIAENKHVSIHELGVPLQLPIGDDVSALHPLHRSVPFAVAYAEVDETCRRTGRAAPKQSHDAENPSLDFSNPAVCFIKRRPGEGR
jgi:hypothetical protein